MTYRQCGPFICPFIHTPCKHEVITSFNARHCAQCFNISDTECILASTLILASSMSASGLGVRRIRLLNIIFVRIHRTSIPVL